MQTRKALRKMSGYGRELGDGPLSEIANDLVAAWRDREDKRMAAAHDRAALVGVGPHLDVLRRVVRQAEAEDLTNNEAPAIMLADFHALLQRHAANSESRDRGIRRAATHAGKLWEDDPTGALSVAELTAFRDHYQTEFPRSKTASVIEREVPKYGFNTLPLAKLNRVAMIIASKVQQGFELQAAYDTAVQDAGLYGKDPQAIRARCYIRGLLGSEPESEAPTLSAEDTYITRVAQELMDLEEEEGLEEDLMMEEDPMLADEPGAESEEATIESPITGEDLIIELEPAPSDADAEGELADDMMDVTPEGVDSLQMLGQLEDLDMDMDMESDEPDDLGDISMDPMPDETVTVMDDPTDPEGGELEITVKRLEEEPEENEGDMLTDLEDSVEEEDLDMTAARSFVVYAFDNGKRASEPVEEFKAIGMAHALRRLAQMGVRGEIRSTDTALASEALIVVDAAAGQYLQVTAKDDDAGEDSADYALTPEINEQQPDQLDVPDDGGAALKQSFQLRLSSDEINKRCANLNLSAQAVERRLLAGESVEAAGWKLACTDTFDVSVTYANGEPRVASMSDLDDEIATFMYHVASAPVDVRRELIQQPAPKLNLEVTELFAVRCGSCGSIDEYIADSLDDVSCGGCGNVTPARRIAQLFTDGDPVTGYLLMADVPEAAGDQAVTARRMLAAVKRIDPDARGTLKREGKLELAVSGDAATLARVRRVLEDTYGIREITAQAVAEPAMDALGEPQQDATSMQQHVTVGPADQQPGQDAEVPPGTAVPQPTAPVTAAFEVHYDAADGAQTVQVQASDSRTASMLFSRFNPGVQILKIAQLDAEPMPMPMGDEPEPMPMGMDPSLGMEPDPMGMEPGLGDPGLGMEPAAGAMDQEQEEALRAALLHYRNQGDGPMTALNHLSSQYREIIDASGSEKTDPARHELEARAIALVREIWSQPAIMAPETVKSAAPTQAPAHVSELVVSVPTGAHATDAARNRRVISRAVSETSECSVVNSSGDDLTLRFSAELSPAEQEQVLTVLANLGVEAIDLRVAAIDAPKVNTQQPDQVSGVPSDLGPDSATVSSSTDAIVPPKVNTQVDTLATQPGAAGADTSTEPDTANKDPGSFGAPKPQAHPDQQSQSGESFPDTNLGEDSQNGESPTTKSMDSASSAADGAYRSK